MPIDCVDALRNAFVRGQHELGEIFDTINGYDGVWKGMVPSDGAFPVGSGFAARTTTIGQFRYNFSQLNLWQPMVGMQADCATSCDPQNNYVSPTNGQNDWYRLLEVAYNSEPFCLEKMFADSLSLEEQIAQMFENLKFLSSDVMDEFYRNNFNALSRYHYFGYDNGSGTQQLIDGGWRFATDANGFADTTYIILDQAYDPNNISALAVSGILNRIRERASAIGMLAKTGSIDLVTDVQTFEELPLYDTNRRADNRFREPNLLNPAYGDVRSYANYMLKEDPFALSYNYTEDDPAYPNGVLKRITQWDQTPLNNGGCLSVLSRAYQDADFMISIPWPMRPVFAMQSGEQPLSAGSGVTFADPASPWNGVWRFVNEINEITPCNVDRNKGFWRMVLKKAAKPRNSGFSGNLVLHRRFPWRGIARICRPLEVYPTGGTYDCDTTCFPLDWTPPPLDDVPTQCGGWHRSSCGSLD